MLGRENIKAKPHGQELDAQADDSHLSHTSGRLRRSAPPPGLRLTPVQTMQQPAALTGQHSNPRPPFPAQTLRRHPGALQSSAHAITKRHMPHTLALPKRVGLLAHARASGSQWPRRQTLEG